MGERRLEIDRILCFLIAMTLGHVVLLSFRRFPRYLIFLDIGQLTRPAIEYFEFFFEYFIVPLDQNS